MNPFWRELSLSDVEAVLLDAVYEAHAKSTFRKNASTEALALAASGSRSLPNALIAALSTLGERHAPLPQAYDFLNQSHPEAAVAEIIQSGGRVPGWGNSFHQGPDPAWEPVKSILQMHFGEMHTRMLEVTATLHGLGKPLHPNPGAFTAATAIVLGMPKEVSPYLFIAGRLLPWMTLFLQAIK